MRTAAAGTPSRKFTSDSARTISQIFQKNLHDFRSVFDFFRKRQKWQKKQKGITVMSKCVSLPGIQNVVWLLRLHGFLPTCSWYLHLFAVLKNFHAVLLAVINFQSYRLAGFYSSSFTVASTFRETV